MPKTQIPTQNSAPGPPLTSAVAQPVMLPVPTWAAMAVGQCLEAAHSLVIGLCPAGKSCRKRRWNPLAKAAQLYALQPDGEKTRRF